jgi:hypothetical protein
VSKPEAPPPPDLVGAAQAQGRANENSALASNYLNQVNQVGPNGSLTYRYDQNGGFTLPDGTHIPAVTATTTLSPDQQHLLDQQNQISGSLNDLASRGINYVSDATSHSPTASQFNPLIQTAPASGNDQRDAITNAYMQRLQPQIDQDRAALETKLANQGISQGSDAYNNAEREFQQGVNDQRTSALLAGDQQQQMLFNQGLAGSQFVNQAQQQAIQEANYFQTQPLSVLNALRTGNQPTMPQFGNVAGGAQIQAAPIYQATADQYAAAMQNYNAQLQQSSGLMSGIAGLGSAAIMASDRRLKKGIRYLFTRADGLRIYLYRYIWGGPLRAGVMADEVARLRPDALGPVIYGFATVNYGVL